MLVNSELEKRISMPAVKPFLKEWQFGDCLQKAKSLKSGGLKMNALVRYYLLAALVLI
jgi:hypothetical protein